MQKASYSSTIRKTRVKPAKEVDEKEVLFSNAPIIRKHRVLPNRTNDKKLLKWLVKKDKA